MLGTHCSSTPIPQFIRRPYLEVRFALICFQHLSRADIVTQRCPWRDNWHARGRPTPFLSYEQTEAC